jgi:hypothetical protein
MNEVLREPDDSLYVISLRHIENNATGFTVSSKCLWKDGNFRCKGTVSSFKTLAEAKKKLKDMAKTKVKRRGAVPVSITELPEDAFRHLAPELGSQISQEDMVALIEKSRRERYVVFKNVSGLEEWFDTGIEYLAEKGEDEEFMTVYDRYGDPRDTLRVRFESVRDTEVAEELAQAQGR